MEKPGWKRVTLPAYARLPLATLLLLLTIPNVSIQYVSSTEPSDQYQLSSAAKSSVSRALSWLATNQYSNGSYGPYTEVATAPAAYALWLNNSQSLKAKQSFTWLASEFDDENSGIWFEADIPGEILYTLSLSNNLELLASGDADYARLQAFQDPSGGFRGYFDISTYQTVTSSVDTSMALLGLVNAKAIPLESKQLAILYLQSLQNQDGSFNLTSAIKSEPLYSLGPEPIAITGLVALALKTASIASNDPSITKALNYLSQAASGNFTGHVYAAAISGLAFNAFGLASDASKATSFIVANQSPDGSFKDRIRSQTSSPALDTGWAAIALQLVPSEPAPTGLLNQSSSFNLSLAVEVAVAIAVLVLISFALYRWRRKQALAFSGQAVP